MRKYKKLYLNNLKKIDEEGLLKKERIIKSPQNIHTVISDNKKTLNFCANNYLGLANHPKIIEAAKSALDSHGFGMASVRFICGTQDLHIKLEKKISKFFGTDDSILYSSCFDANSGLFETILNNEDAIISDELNHASIIDGIRLCKAQRFRYKNSDMRDLEKKLIKTQNFRLRMIATDGVFSMDGKIAKLDKIVELAEKYNAMVMVDDSHATGFIGENGKGSAEYCGVMKKIDVFTSTLGKALGGASGGFTTGKKEIIDLLRQKSRPYLFSNSVAPPIVSAALVAFNIIETNIKLKKTLENNTLYFRDKIIQNGFDIIKGSHPIIPIMLYDAKKTQEMAKRLLKEGIYAVGFYYPVVPKNKARIRVQISSAMDKKILDKGIDGFQKVGKELGII